MPVSAELLHCLWRLFCQGYLDGLTASKVVWLTHLYTICLTFQTKITWLDRSWPMQTCLQTVNLHGHFQLTYGVLLLALTGFKQGPFPYPLVCSGAEWLRSQPEVGDPRGGGQRQNISLWMAVLVCSPLEWGAQWCWVQQCDFFCSSPVCVVLYLYLPYALSSTQLTQHLL